MVKSLPSPTFSPAWYFFPHCGGSKDNAERERLEKRETKECTRSTVGSAREKGEGPKQGDGKRENEKRKDEMGRSQGLGNHRCGWKERRSVCAGVREKVREREKKNEKPGE